MREHQPLNQIVVNLDFGAEPIFVGRLASRDNTVYFQYAPEFLERGIEISPLKIPLGAELFSFKPHLFDGLPGVFSDSLPDGWGRLLIDRYLRSNGVLPQAFTPLDRLAFAGSKGLGALTFQPDQTAEEIASQIDLDSLAHSMAEVLSGESTEVLNELIGLNGSSAGARPKALIGVPKDFSQIIHGTEALPAEFRHWLVKFPNTNDGKDAGAIEYVYSLMAAEAGLEITDTHLFAAAKGPGYFAIERFDRKGNERHHMHTASGLLHADFRTPSLDYEDLMALTEYLTRDVREVEKMFRLAAFNTLSHNRDDHGKNFSFLMNARGTWTLSPAYDLTFSSGPRGHMSTMIMGEGMYPTHDHIRRLGRVTNLKPEFISQVIDQTRHALNKWEELALNFGVSQSNIRLIGSRLIV